MPGRGGILRRRDREHTGEQRQHGFEERQRGFESAYGIADALGVLWWIRLGSRNWDKYWIPWTMEWGDFCKPVGADGFECR